MKMIVRRAALVKLDLYVRGRAQPDHTFHEVERGTVSAAELGGWSVLISAQLSRRDPSNGESGCVEPSTAYNRSSWKLDRALKSYVPHQ